MLVVHTAEHSFAFFYERVCITANTIFHRNLLYAESTCVPVGFPFSQQFSVHLIPPSYLYRRELVWTLPAQTEKGSSPYSEKDTSLFHIQVLRLVHLRLLRVDQGGRLDTQLD